MNPYDEAHDLMKCIRQAGRHHEEGDDDAARAIYREVWRLAEERGDAFHACLAAHMLGVMEPSPDEKLRWHVASLDRAQRVGGERVAGFYPSLYANLGSVYRQLGRRDEAIAAYRQARQHERVLKDDAYGDGLRADIAAGLDELYAGEGQG